MLRVCDDLDEAKAVIDDALVEHESANDSIGYSSEQQLMMQLLDRHASETYVRLRHNPLALTDAEQSEDSVIQTLAPAVTRENILAVRKDTFRRDLESCLDLDKWLSSIGLGHCLAELMQVCKCACIPAR